ncbi:hypothetical protein [Brevibacillus laterosporus]|uniref:hypothetical protein n=1 Tax=Brevibacillus laterosporus TaxID=1465 RepID=UPI0019699562|nr:hypothetical protein [Brevibacillus laterosporus]
MAVFRQVQTSFWQDARVLEEMTPEDKYFYLYLLTNPCTKQIGVYPISKKTMAFEMGYSIESVNALFDRFERNHRLIKYNSESRELALLNWGKYNFRKGGKPVEDCIKKELRDVKDLSLVADVLKKIDSPSIRKIFIGFLNESGFELDDTYHDTSTSGGQEKEEEKEEEKEKEKDLKDIPSPNSSKRKEKPKKKYAEFVSMQEVEYEKLVAKHGKYLAEKMIEKLDNYKGANGKKYKSDYRAILNWVEEKVLSEQPKGGKANNAGSLSADRAEQYRKAGLK